MKLRDVKVGDQAMIGMGYDYFRVMVMAQEPGDKVKVIRTGFGADVNRARVLDGFILDGDHEADILN